MSSKQAVIIINKQEIPWSFIQKVRRICGGDWDQTLDIFYKCRTVGGNAGIVRYISKGLFDYAQGKRWIMVPSQERENGQMEAIRRWWDSLYNRKPRTDVVSFKDALKEMAAGL